MGQTAADTQREIDGLRVEITDAASELDKRVTEMLDVRARANDLMSWTLRMVDERPKAVAGVGAGIVLGAALASINGALIAFARLPSIVVTLATMVALRDGLRWTMQGAWVENLPSDFQWLGLGQAARSGRAFPRRPAWPRRAARAPRRA